MIENSPHAEWDTQLSLGPLPLETCTYEAKMKNSDACR